MKIKLKEDQVVLDEQDNRYIIEKGDVLLEKNDNLTLLGKIKGQIYKIYIEGLNSFKDWSLSLYKVYPDYNEEIFYVSSFTRQGSKEQAYAKIFLELGLKVPKTDDVGSGLDVKFMFNTLITDYTFKVIE